MLLLRLLARKRNEHDRVAFALQHVVRETNLADPIRRRFHQPSGARYPWFGRKWWVVASSCAFRCRQLHRKRHRFPRVAELIQLGSLPLHGMEFGTQRFDIMLEERPLLAGHVMPILIFLAFGSREFLFDQLGRPLPLPRENKCGDADRETVPVVIHPAYAQIAVELCQRRQLADRFEHVLVKRIEQERFEMRLPNLPVRAEVNIRAEIETETTCSRKQWFHATKNPETKFVAGAIEKRPSQQM